WCDWKAAANDVSPSLVKFQFLYGAIGSILIRHVFLLLFQFQFLYGASGRLEVLISIAGNNHFNSYMVRLEDERPNLYGRFHIFQFLYGAIGRKFRIIVKIPVSNFNSYMVRLEVGAKVNLEELVTFQFLYGAIGSYRCRSQKAD